MENMAILHSDLNNFYASVECMERPELRNKPVAVVGDAEARHGIVLAKNYLAKGAGVKTGMVIWEAKQLCPGLITVGARFDLYLKYSRAVRRIYSDYTDRIEPFGIDECWLDVSQSQNLFGGGKEIAELIRARVKEECGLTVSIGVSWNKIFAKLGSDMKKPDAITVITPANYQELVWPLPAEDLLYVGRATKRKLANINIKTVGGIATVDSKLLEQKLGKWGLYLHTFANGLDHSPVAKEGDSIPIKSVGNSLTNYRDMVNEEEVKTLIYMLVESVVSRCREIGVFKVRTVHISVRDSKLLYYGHQGKLPFPSMLTREIAQFAFALFRESYAWNQTVRGIGISVSDFVTDKEEQISLLRDEEKYKKQDRLEKAVDRIRKTYGNNSVQRGNVLQDDKLKEMDIKDEHVIHPESFFKK